MPADPGNGGPDRAGTRFADVRWVDETGSTNADALALARGGAPEGIVLVADHQTAGRGRLGRTWQAPPGASLLLTVLLRPPVAAVETVTAAAALAMSAAVLGVTGVDARLKWPNDLTVDDRKLAGILAEAEWRAPDDVAVAVGIGVNVNWPPLDEVPEELREILTALNHRTGADVDRRALLGAFLVELDRRYLSDAVALRDEWRTRSATLGRAVRVETGDGVVEGTAVDVTERGHLVVDTGAGGTTTFAVGDVTHLRHAPRRS